MYLKYVSLNTKISLSRELLTLEQGLRALSQLWEQRIHLLSRGMDAYWLEWQV